MRSAGPTPSGDGLIPRSTRNGPAIWSARSKSGVKRRFAQLVPSHFKVIGKIQGVQTVAANRSIRAIAYLRRKYGARDWRKRKGLAKVQLDDGTIGRGEVHWYEAHGIGKKESKLKWFRED